MHVPTGITPSPLDLSCGVGQTCTSASRQRPAPKLTGACIIRRRVEWGNLQRGQPDHHTHCYTDKSHTATRCRTLPNVQPCTPPNAQPYTLPEEQPHTVPHARLELGLNDRTWAGIQVLCFVPSLIVVVYG